MGGGGWKMGSVCVGPDIQLRLGPRTHMDFQQGNSERLCVFFAVYVMSLASRRHNVDSTSLV